MVVDYFLKIRELFVKIPVKFYVKCKIIIKRKKMEEKEKNGSKKILMNK
jgi:hypothetical protein